VSVPVKAAPYVYIKEEEKKIPKIDDNTKVNEDKLKIPQ
jgi:hypothetical protein